MGLLTGQPTTWQLDFLGVNKEGREPKMEDTVFSGLLSAVSYFVC